MSAAAPNPKDIAILAALGIGVYWFMTRRAVAATPQAVSLAANTPTTAQALATSAAGLIGKLLGTASSAPAVTPGTYDGRAAVPWSPAATGANNPSAYLASSAVDGIAANIPNTAVYDAANASYASDDPAAWWQ
jgi:hypothetical protein